MDRSNYRGKAIKYFALVKSQRDLLMAAQLKSVADAFIRFAAGEQTPDLLYFLMYFRPPPITRRFISDQCTTSAHGPQRI
jgi:hypothetical protein